MRFAMTAATLARQRKDGEDMNDITALNVKKVTQFREGGEDELERMVNNVEDARWVAQVRGRTLQQAKAMRKSRAGDRLYEQNRKTGEVDSEESRPGGAVQ